MIVAVSAFLSLLYMGLATYGFGKVQHTVDRYEVVATGTAILCMWLKYGYDKLTG